MGFVDLELNVLTLKEVTDASALQAMCMIQNLISVKVSCVIR